MRMAVEGALRLINSDAGGSDDVIASPVVKDTEVAATAGAERGRG
jgi:hypothetical protein